MTALYLCYQSVAEPLTQTQVVAYLEGLADAGRRVVLLTFEPRPPSEPEVKAWTGRLKAKGIAWHWLRYHKSPTVPATLWDVLAGVVTGLSLVRKYRVRLLHARSHVPGVMALSLKRLTGVKFLFDVRGFMAEEYVDAGIWPAGGLLFRTTKGMERLLVRAADGLVVLTHKGKELLERWYPQAMANKPVQVIPCCVDLRQVPPESAGPERYRGVSPKTLVYTGKLGGWYMTEAMVEFVVAARQFMPGLRWNVWTQSESAGLRRLLAAHNLEQHVSVGRMAPEALPRELVKASAALSFIKPCVSKLGSSPTKIGEYLAAGLPVVSTAGIGDLDELLAGTKGGDGGPVGVVVQSVTPEGFRAALVQLQQLLDDPQTPQRCRKAALEHLDLEQVGWVRYRDLYQRLLEG
jgi:glycosyltransferase involved in cell wall biosynthesis